MAIDSKIITHVKNVLNKFDDKYVDSYGGIKKYNVINDLNEFNYELMVSLFNDAIIYDNYVEKINDTDVFKLNQFISMFEYKSFWEDSYTKFSNKIGLTSDNKFIEDSSDVILDFPYKDTVLRAGMTKEDNNDDYRELFLNETIAKPEINEIFEPKIFINTKKIDENGEKDLDDFSIKDNLIIKGNNLIALHSLKNNYSNKIESIFIDPPYFFIDNKPADTFPYNSNFKLSTWLTFLKNRLEISKKLLTDTGNIFITVSDEGAHYIKVLTDSIFGMSNFIADITWESRKSMSSDALISNNSNHILVYAKNISKINKDSFRLSLNIESFKFNDNDGRGPYRIEPFDAPNIRKNLSYEIVTPSGRKVYPKVGRSWRTEENKYKKLLDDNRIYFGKKGDAKPQLKAYYYDVKDAGKGKVSNTIWKNIDPIIWTDAGTNTNATRHQMDLFGEKVFNNPKPEQLVQRIIELSTKKDDIVLDFFMGSATTQAVAMKMKRRFIGIEQMDYIKSVSVNRLKKVIDGDQGGISKDVNWNGGGSFIYTELMDKNNGYLHDVLNSRNVDELEKVFNLMKENADLDFRLDLKKYDENKKEKSLEELKTILVQMIDKNQLYYNESNIDDEIVRDLISDSDYMFNKNFYSNNS